MKFESCLRLADTLNSGCLITTHNRVSTPHHLLYVSTKRNIPEFLENTLVTKIICTEFLWSTKKYIYFFLLLFSFGKKGLGVSSWMYTTQQKKKKTEIERYIKFTRRVLIVIIQSTIFSFFYTIFIKKLFSTPFNLRLNNIPWYMLLLVLGATENWFYVNCFG